MWLGRTVLENRIADTCVSGAHTHWIDVALALVEVRSHCVLLGHTGGRMVMLVCYGSPVLRAA